MDVIINLSRQREILNDISAGSMAQRNICVRIIIVAAVKRLKIKILFTVICTMFIMAKLGLVDTDATLYRTTPAIIIAAEAYNAKTGKNEPGEFGVMSNLKISCIIQPDGYIWRRLLSEAQRDRYSNERSTVAIMGNRGGADGCGLHNVTHTNKNESIRSRRQDIKTNSSRL